MVKYFPICRLHSCTSVCEPTIIVTMPNCSVVLTKGNLESYPSLQQKGFFKDGEATKGYWLSGDLINSNGLYRKINPWSSDAELMLNKPRQEVALHILEQHCGS